MSPSFNVDVVTCTCPGCWFIQSLFLKKSRQAASLHRLTMRKGPSCGLDFILNCSFLPFSFSLVYIDVKANNASPEELPELKKYIAYKFEEHHRHHPETMCVVLMDMYGASTSNVVSADSVTRPVMRVIMRPRKYVYFLTCCRLAFLEQCMTK